jgi:hypothetical protein
MNESSNTTQLMAILLVTPEALTELLQLPLGAYIDGIQAPIDQPGALAIRIRGAGWAITPGQIIPRAPNGIVTVTYDENGRVLSRLVDWRLPSHDMTTEAAP